MIFIFFTLLLSLITFMLIALINEPLKKTPIFILFGASIPMCFISMVIILPISSELNDQIDKLKSDNSKEIQLAVDSINLAHKTIDEFNDTRFQKTAQESYLVWELLHSIYKQDSIRWYKDIRTSPEYKELDKFLVGDWEDFYLY